MYLDLYQQETEKLAEKQSRVLNELHDKIINHADLSLIEEQAMLHSLQIIIEKSIGKARQILKAKEEKVPVSGYELFEKMEAMRLINNQELKEWKKVIGLRNTIVHEYMKIDIMLVKNIVTEEQYLFVLGFLNAPFSQFLKKITGK